MFAFDCMDVWFFVFSYARSSSYPTDYVFDVFIGIEQSGAIKLKMKCCPVEKRQKKACWEIGFCEKTVQQTWLSNSFFHSYFCIFLDRIHMDLLNIFKELSNKVFRAIEKIKTTRFFTVQISIIFSDFDQQDFLKATWS